LFVPEEDNEDEEPVFVLWRESDFNEMRQILKDRMADFEKEEDNSP
jgi:hypothetical protein